MQPQSNVVDDVAAADDNHLSDDSEGDSGDLQLDAPIIRANLGAKLLAHANAGFSAGDVALRANGSLDDITSALVTLPLLPDFTVTRAEISLDTATIKGRDVTIDADRGLFCQSNAPHDTAVMDPGPPRRRML